MTATPRLALLDQIQRCQASVKSWSDVGLSVCRAIQQNPCGISFALVYRYDALRPGLILVGAAGIAEGHPAAPAAMALDGTAIWPAADALQTRTPLRVDHFDHAIGLEGLVGISGARPGLAFVVPLVPGEADGAMIVGLDAASAPEPETSQFVTLLAGLISACAAHAFLAYNRSTFQTLADTAPAALFIKDRAGRYLFANPLTRAMLSPDGDLVGRTDEDVLPAEAAARLRDHDAHVFDNAEPIQREEQLGEHTFLFVKFPWRGPEGGTIGIYGVAIDITERKQDEAALRRIAKKYRAIGESIDYGVWVCDAMGRNIFASESFLALTGLSQEQCSDGDWPCALHPEEADLTMRAWQRCVDHGSLWSRELRVKGVDGNYHHVLARGVPVRNDGGEIERWVGINLDIHQIKEAEDRLREIDRRNDQFLAMLAHELRNPLVPIRNSLHLLHASGLATGMQRDAHDMMSRQVENLVRLVSDMLDLGRIAQHKLALHPSRVDVASLIEAAIERARPHFARNNHQMLVQLPDEPLSLMGDPDRLTQVLSNLLINSATYTPAGEHVELHVRRVDDALEITVTDNGVAAVPELHNSAADTLTRYQDGVPLTEGVGVGLALVKDLVEMHGGTVVSVRADAGAPGTVGVRLPIGSEPDASRVSCAAAEARR